MTKTQAIEILKAEIQLEIQELKRLFKELADQQALSEKPEKVEN